MINLPRGEYVKIEDGNRADYVFSLANAIEKKIEGPLGSTVIKIENGKARIQD